MRCKYAHTDSNMQNFAINLLSNNYYHRFSASVVGPVNMTGGKKERKKKELYNYLFFLLKKDFFLV